MGSLNFKLVLLLVIAIYAVSWFLPIFSGGGPLGYIGAGLAIEALESGVKYFGSPDTSEADSISEALFQIIVGSCNICFIVAALFAFFKPVWSYVLAPLIVVSMLFWFSKDVGIGYYLWLLSGVSLFVYTLYMVHKQHRVSLPGVLVSVWSLPIYVPIVVTGAVYLSLYLKQSA